MSVHVEQCLTDLSTLLGWLSRRVEKGQIKYALDVESSTAVYRGLLIALGLRPLSCVVLNYTGVSH